MGEIDGVRWFNDSKATSPHAALTAIRSFDRVVLLAGGLNKGLDLSSLATEKDHVKAVIGLGSSAADITDAFDGMRPTSVARLDEGSSDRWPTSSRLLAMSCCCHRRAPASIGIPRVGTRPAATTSGNWCEELAVRRKEVRNG